MEIFPLPFYVGSCHYSFTEDCLSQIHVKVKFKMKFESTFLQDSK